MTPDLIEALRKQNPLMPSELFALALDGLRFRLWVELASTQPAAVAVALASSTRPADYRRAIDSLIVRRARGGL